MKSSWSKSIPLVIAGVLLLLTSLLACISVDFFERQERMTYDWRVRLALHFSAPVYPGLGFAQIDDETIATVKNGSLGYGFGLYWPRQVYGRLINELQRQGAEVVALDVLFGELREDHKGVRLVDGSYMDSDAYFAAEMRRAGNVLLAVTTNLTPPELFTSAAAGLGDISTDRDSDGILRRARAFTWHRVWHPLLRALETKPGAHANLRHARIESLAGQRKLLVPLENASGEVVEIPLDDQNNFTITPSADAPDQGRQQAPAFTMERIWHMGICLAAWHLKLDLTNAVVDLEHGRITLNGPDRMQRTIPVDREGYFYVDWVLRPDDPRLTSEPVHKLLREQRARALGAPVDPPVRWRDKLVVVGSSALGNDLTDLGATPLDKSTLLVSKHWNVANSVITGRFIRTASAPQKVGLIILLGGLTTFVTTKFRIGRGLIAVLALAVTYVLVSLALFVQARIWLPLFLPLVGAVAVNYGLQIAYRALFEQREQRRVKGIFSKVVSPNVTKELLGRKSLSLSGERVAVTVLFADVRGFTELTDTREAAAADYIQRHHLEDEQADSLHNESAREILHTVNSYLAIVADIVKKHDGTLDKYIGDCVMAFWGAPTAQPDHATICVRAAIEAQRAIQTFNASRQEENRQIETANAARVADGLPPRPFLPVLTLGTGINTGMVTVGLMGSNAHILNYTIFGREVNLASRLESVSGHGRIVIGEGTYQALLQKEPELAAACIELEPARLKGFQKPVRNFEVRW